MWHAGSLIPAERNDKMYCMVNYHNDNETTIYYNENNKTYTVNIRFYRDTIAIYELDIEALEKLINKLNKELKRHIEALYPPAKS